MKRVVKYLHKRKGLLFSVIYLLSTFISCFVLLFFDNDIKLIFYNHFINEYQIDKVAFLSIMTAIIIAIVTTLTLSISIEGNDGNKRFGKTPKELNDYLDYPISLNCAFAGLIIYFVFSICFMKFGCTTTFYFFSLTTLGYYFVSLLIGLPVITGDSKKVYDVISRSLNSNDAVSSKDASNVILYLFSKGYSIEEIYKNLNMSLITNQKNVVKVMLNLYLEFIISGNETFIIISLLEKKIIKEIKTYYSYYGINFNKEKGILLGGRYNDILILRNDNYKCVQIIKNAHDDYIKGFINLKNGFIVSYSDDGKIKIWSFGY